MRWLNLAAYKPSAGAGVASTPIDNAFQAIMDAVNGATVAGAPVASASTIPVTNPVHAITGTVTIANISDANSPTQGETVTLWIQNGLTIQNNGGGTGNIRTKTGNDRVLVANEIITFMYDGAVWREEGPGIGGAIVGTKVSQLGTGYEGAQARLRIGPATFNNGGATGLPAATLTVGDTSEFPNSGGLDCGANGTVTYTGKTATTFTGCTGGTGTLAAGQTVALATAGVATLAWEDLALIYDSTLAKWVSNKESCFIDVADNSASFSEGFVSGTSTSAIAAALRWRARQNAGLAPQIRFTGWLSSNGGSGTGTNGKVGYRTQNFGSAASAEVDTPVAVAVTAGGAYRFSRVFPWCDPFNGTPPAVADVLLFTALIQGVGSTGGGSGFELAGQVDVRWVG